MISPGSTLDSELTGACLFIILLPIFCVSPHNHYSPLLTLLRPGQRQVSTHAMDIQEEHGCGAELLKHTKKATSSMGWGRQCHHFHCGQAGHRE